MNKNRTPICLGARVRKAVTSLVALSLLTTSTLSTRADILGEMNGLMNDIVTLPGEMVSGLKDVPADFKGSIMADGPSAFRGQTYNTYMGGRVFQRMPIRQFPKIIEAEMPHFSAGCGGIDMTFGSISVLDGSKLVDFMKAVAMNMTGVITQVALKAITPLLGTTLEWAKDVVDKINGFNKNSCEVAQSLVSGGMNAMTADKHAQCVENEMVYSSLNIDEAREKCKTAAGVKAGEAKKPKFAGNLTWEALKKVLPPTNDNLGERMLIMSMVGTVIYYKDGEGPTDSTTAVTGIPGPSKDGASSTNGKNRDDEGNEMVSKAVAPRHYAATITDMADLLYGNSGAGAATASTSAGTGIMVGVWDCGTDKDKCLSPTQKAMGMPAYSQVVYDNMKSIADAIANHQPLTADQHLLINQSTMPLYKMMSVGSAVKGSMIAELLIDSYKDVIAADYVWALVGRNMKEGVAALRQGFDLSTPQQEDVRELITNGWVRMQGLRAQHDQAQSKVVNTQALDGVIEQVVRALHGSTPQGVQDMLANVGS